MKTTGKFLTVFLAVMMVLCIGVTANAETTLQFGTTVNEQDSFQVAAEKFAELVSERTGGEYVIEIYPNGTLGGEADMLESMSMGMLDMGIITAGPFVNYSSMMGVLDMPFLFADNGEAYKILDGEIGRELLDLLDGKLSISIQGHHLVVNRLQPAGDENLIAYTEAE